MQHRGADAGAHGRELLRAACGTAVVVTPVKSVLYNNAVHNVGSGADQVGPVVRSLYDSVRAIQVGDQEDTLGWMMEAAA